MGKEQILIECLKGLIAFEDRFELVPPDLAEWICERLAWHKLLPLAAAISDPSKPKDKKLDSIFQHVLLKNAIREKHYEKQVRKVFPIFKDAAIHFMPYKGPFWGQQLYPEYAWRHIGDIDLLLPIDDARRASAILQDMGFIPDLMTDSEDQDFAQRGALTLLSDPSKTNEFPMQLHWELMPSPRFLKRQYIPSHYFFIDTSTARWRGIAFEVPRPEVQFIYYILHATCQHQFMRFVHIMVMAHFINKFEKLKWALVRELAEKQGALVPLYYGLTFIHAFSPLPEPAAALMDRIRPPLYNRMAARLLPPKATLLFTQKDGNLRRNLFRVVLS
jgi:hypothetical protein